ncbi:sensor histidine kinase [Clostridium oryzae]|uniref:Sensor histidine kinase YpdA n=1 Tax=Clostridium oryzae TaxID=1450648 RepID=A0A1V4IHS2_9CLOT|nr:sensor histidine kinase [Clostridium oryzae]OPJ59503.1 sensor histidine kinase YpdA [Clostridium oryzae]
MNIKRVLKDALINITDKIESKLVNKLIIIFTSVVTCIIIIVVLLSYRIIKNELVKGNIENNKNIIKIVNRNTEKYFNEVRQFSLPQFKYEDLIRALNTESGDYDEQLYLEGYLREMFYSRRDIEGIYLYIIKKHKYYYITRQNEDIRVRIAYDNTIPRSSWYKTTISSKENSFFQPILLQKNLGYCKNPGDYFLAYHTTINNISTRKPQAMISFYFNSYTIKEVLKDIPINNGEHIILLNSDDIPFYFDTRKFYYKALKAKLFKTFTTSIDQGKTVWNNKTGKYLVIYSNSEINNMKLAKFIPYTEMYRAVKTNRNVTLFMGFVCMLFATALIAFTSKAITKPLKKLSYNMDRFSEGYFDVKTEVYGKDEVSQLSKQFNVMVKSINDLINDKYKAKLVEQRAILKALEAEVNPHFLYNALQAISTKALKNGLYDVSEMIDALAMTFRYCINGGDIVDIRSEIKHVENYIMLQKARFGDRLQIIYEIDEDIRNVEIPKLSIQTLVENSIKHSLEKASDNMTIVIKGYRENGKAVIIVKDNGRGISKEKLDSILESFDDIWDEKQKRHIGIKNLYMRLKLIFGEQASMKIKSSNGSTEVIIFIPIGG